MRIMVIVNGNEEATAKMEASQKEKMYAAMGSYNEELVKAGVMLAAAGLLPTSRGKRVVFAGVGATRVVDGPFTETKEVIGGFWLWQVKNMDEALEWARRCPCDQSWESNLELRVVGEMEDFGSELTPELRARKERLRGDIAQKREP